MVIPNYSVYPQQLDSTTELPINVDNQTYVRAEVVNRIRSAVVNIETELGAHPSSIYGNVRDRLDFIEAQVIQTAGGWYLFSNIVQLSSDIFTVNFNNHIITSSGNPTWDFGTGNATFGGQVDVVGPFRISDINLPASGDFRLPIDFSANVFTSGGDGALITCAADGAFYRWSIGAEVRASYGELTAATGITLNIGTLAKMYVTSGSVIIYPNLFEFSSAASSPIIGIVQQAIADTAGTALAIKGQKAGLIVGAIGKIGGATRIYGGEGADGTAGFAAGPGGAAALYGGSPGADNGGGGAAGGSCYIDPAAGTDAGPTHGQIYIGVTSSVTRKTKQINLCNATDNPPIVQTGTGTVTFTGITTVPILKIADANLPATGDLQLPIDFSAKVYTTGGDGPLFTCYADGTGYDLSIGDDTRARYVYLGASVAIGSLTPIFQWANWVASPSILHETDITVGGIRPMFHVQAQSTTVALGTGGTLSLESGDGATHGTVQILIGGPAGTTMMEFAPGWINFPSGIGVTATGNPTWNFGTSLATFGGSVAFGASPGASGIIRLTDTNNITWLNGGNTYALASGQGLYATLGGPYPTRPPAIIIDSSSVTYLQIAGSSRITLQSNELSLTTQIFDFVTSVPSPVITQQDLTTVAGTGQTMLIHAQDETGGGASVGGALNIRAGHGATHGVLTLQDAGGAAVLTITATDTLNLGKALGFITATGAPHWDMGVGGVNNPGIEYHSGTFFQEGITLTTANTPYDIDPAVGLVFLCDVVGGVLTLNLPSVGDSEFRRITIVDWTGHAAANNITIIAQVGETVNGLASIKIVTNYGGAELYSDGITWRTLQTTV